MNLKEILSISGTAGLFSYVAQSKNGIIVESMDAAHRRQIISGSAKVSSLGDIAIFTTTTEVSLADVFEKIRVANKGAAVAIDGKSTPEQLTAFIEGILPDFDRSRVHNSDIKKVAQWYNILIATGIESFVEKADEAASDAAAVVDKAVTAKKATVKKPATAVKAKTGAASSKSKVGATKGTTARKSS